MGMRAVGSEVAAHFRLGRFSSLWSFLTLGKSIVATASFTIFFLLILIHASEDAKSAVSQRDVASGVR